MTGRIVVVVGTGGMGMAIARRQGGGRKLLLADFDEAALETSVTALSDEGFDVTAHPVDVASHESVDALAEHAASLGAVTEVVHSAGLSPVQAGAEAVLRVDLLGVAFSLDAFGRVIAEGGAGVVIASMAGHMLPPLPNDQERALATTDCDALLGLPFLQPDVVNTPEYAYPLAKRANLLRVRAASRVWARRGARINSISPGVISTPMSREELDGASGEAMRAMIAMSGAGRVGTAADIADAAAFLLGPTATFITGTDILVDGGVIAAVSGARTPTA